MSKKEEPPYRIEPVEKPIISRSFDYDVIIEDLKKRESGWYKIQYRDKEAKSLYIALKSRADKANIKLHVRKNILYAEKP